MTHWRDIELVGPEGEPFKHRGESDDLWAVEIIGMLRDWRNEGGISGYFLARLDGQDEDSPDTWGPKVEAVNWTGFPLTENEIPVDFEIGMTSGELKRLKARTR